MSENLSREEAQEILRMIVDLAHPITTPDDPMLEHNAPQEWRYQAARELKESVAARAWKMLEKLSQSANLGQKPG
jgi:hypothetical protein